MVSSLALKISWMIYLWDCDWNRKAPWVIANDKSMDWKSPEVWSTERIAHQILVSDRNPTGWTYINFFIFSFCILGLCVWMLPDVARSKLKRNSTNKERERNENGSSHIPCYICGSGLRPPCTNDQATPVAFLCLLSWEDRKNQI